MRFARYWVPAILGFVLGSILSLRMSGTPMRDLLALAKWDAANEPRTAASNAMGSTSPLEENDRFARIFSALQEVRGLKKRSELHSAIGGLSAAELEALMNRIEALRGRLHSDDLNEVVLQRWFQIDRAGEMISTRWCCNAGSKLTAPVQEPGFGSTQMCDLTRSFGPSRIRRSPSRS
jgi:hypothetical protein